MIGIINYKAGNGPSVYYALRKIGVPCELIDSAGEIMRCSRFIFPGVGSAGATMRSLAKIGCLDALRRKILVEKAPFLGICVGLQVLFDYSEEESTTCLGWVAGDVRHFPQEDLRVPQIGWNDVRINTSHPLMTGIPDGSYFYFVNSYYASPADPADVIGTTEYGVSFCSILGKKNVFATQFHTEKSGPVGLRLLRNFATLPQEDLTC